MKIKSVLPLLASILLLCGCGVNYQKLSVESYSIERVGMRSLRSINVSLDLGLNNGGNAFTVTDATVTLKREGVEVGTVDVDDIFIAGKCFDHYSLKGVATLADGFSPVQVLGWTNGFNPALFTVDVKAVVVPQFGMKKKINRKDVTLTYFTGRK